MIRIYALVVCLLVSPIALHAHSVLKGSQPADGETLQVTPDEMSLTFGKAIRLTALGMEDGEIALPDQSGFETEFAIPLPVMSRGTHVIEWRGLSVDGHAMTGTLTFTIE